MRISELLANAQQAILQKVSLVDAREAKLEAQFLLQSVLKVNRAWLISHENDALDFTHQQASMHAAFEALLQRRLKGEPIAYILGQREFYGLNLKVTPDTLIPRPDTETLVEAALAKIPNISLPVATLPSPYGNDEEITNTAAIPQATRVLDLGTGTGAVALAIAHSRPQATVTAVDASGAALAIAMENAQDLNIQNTHFVLSDWFAALQGEHFDVIVSNPPYIKQDDEHLQQGDLRFEPLSALASGSDGLDDIRRIIATAPQHLKPHGWLMLEHGYNQADVIAGLLKDAGFKEISHAHDLAGIARVTLGQHP